MISLVLDNAADFKRAIDSVAVLIDEAEFLVDERGLSLKATDPSQISMVDFSLPKASFKSFKADGVAKIGLDLDYLASVLGRAKASDQLSLELDEEHSRLQVALSGNSKRNFSIPLIDVSQSELPTPKIEFEAELRMPASVLQDGLKDAQLISTHVVLGVAGERFVLRANSSKGELNSETAKAAKGLSVLQAKSDCSAMFPLDYLTDMLKAASSDTDVSMFLKNNAPVKVSYAIGPSQITYFLAPRIESD
jgi:proliferating cell nuclear antigen